MKYPAIFIFLISFLVLINFPACKSGHNFAVFDFNKFDTLFLDQFNQIELTSTYILKVTTCEAFFGKEQIIKHVPDSSATHASQFGYFVFQKDGRVYYNTESSDDAYEEIPVKISKTIDVCNEADVFALQGFYSFKEISPEGNEIIKIEFERKKGNSKSKKHYFITAELNKSRTVLHILKFDRPRRNTPIRKGLGDFRKNYKTYNPDLVFAFPLNFHLYDEDDIQLNYQSCPTFVN